MTDEEIIIELYRIENEAMVTKNITKLNEILAPSMELIHMTGYVQKKFEWIDQIQNEQMKYFSSKEENIKDIEVNGDSATLVGQNQVRASVWGSNVNTWPLQMKVYFVKQNGQWVISKQVASTY
ncbi:nuclear transport factor 2 family protein [Companilactobacillus insicii]|uniref:nuclear transport factor 2 family protein n=1 Tax=Companilactobacillus insicii TaxID=1732567 RepID=UPI000F78463C|nr:nuclear transport factor 2 family protein [Companilactobacillus insicii]